jgi:hypothetical protein
VPPFKAMQLCRSRASAVTGRCPGPIDEEREAALNARQPALGLLADARRGVVLNLARRGLGAVLKFGT